jgi:lantibiotic transport system ATP-binding protein
MLAIEVSNLSHYFSRQNQVLDQVSMRVEPGSIYGFLGPNGAGKTTTIRLILGLLQQQEGNIAFFGQDFQANRVHILRRVGSLIESPSMYGHLTAMENLQLLQKIYQCPPANMQKVLDLVGLSNTGRKKVQQFSLGMKQRLGIAIALLPDPEVLILDEPTNGLDPNGMLEMRELLQHIHREAGKTILVSSHLLAEIEKLATHVGIIHRGRMLFEGTLDALLQRRAQVSQVLVRCSDSAALAKAVAPTYNAQIIDYRTVLVAITNADDTARLVQQAVGKGIDLYEVRPNHGDLESIFMEIIRE